MAKKCSKNRLPPANTNQELEVRTEFDTLYKPNKTGRNLGKCILFVSLYDVLVPAEDFAKFYNAGHINYNWELSYLLTSAIIDQCTFEITTIVKDSLAQ